ncbi:Panacea domain-containing protein [Microbacterium sp. MYb66]|uniref:Panacea domain-containing protein n=1 Tax=Microbacterium sp. MYb66 TaxID=1848692 RepID=UPI000CFEDFE6|nr:type II toxin-antitoxin system antitoxin SocA domain-containing protein [Microbacterium sp. MYb66]PRA79721.1 hypothetical protein CQ045_14295 [Microbacterium sp. MYb66]
MANVQDVAAYIVTKCGEMTAMKLQKLVYYSQAWHLVWSERPLFDEEIQAWANGPVVYDLYRKHSGQFRVSDWPEGDVSHLSADETGSIDAVIDAYFPFTAHQLSEMTHQEDPWLMAREGLSDGARSNRPITLASMHEYYSARTA